MPETKTKDRTASLIQVLEYMDGPQAVLLERSDDYRIVAVAINKEGYKYPFFGAGISYDQWERYRRGFSDLRFLFMYPRYRDWYVFDLAEAKGKAITLTKVLKDQFAEDHYVPGPNFFSYDHSEPIKSRETEGSGD